MDRRKLLWTTCALPLTGLLQACTTPSNKPYVPPKDTPLLEPPPGQALFYLLRAPYDSDAISVLVNDTPVAELRPSQYTVIALPAGKHVMRTLHAATFGTRAQIAPTIEVLAIAGERRFLNISGVTGRSVAVIGVLPVQGVILPLLANTLDTNNGTHSWKEVTELDAQGLMSISKPVLPESGAL